MARPHTLHPSVEVDRGILSTGLTPPAPLSPFGERGVTYVEFPLSTNVEMG